MSQLRNCVYCRVRLPFVNCEALYTWFFFSDLLYNQFDKGNPILLRVTLIRDTFARVKLNVALYKISNQVLLVTTS